VLLTHESLVKRGAWLDAQTSLTKHVLCRELWKARQKKFAGGHPWEWQVQVDHNHSARHVKLYQKNASAINDTMVTASVEPRFVNAHYTYDVREKAFNRGPEQIADFLQTKVVASRVSLFELLEYDLLHKPEDSTDTETPYGLEYWVVKNATEGFYGADPSGFTGGRAGLPTATYANLANYSGTYAAVTDEDLLTKLSRMMRKTDFTSVVEHAQPTVGAAGRIILVGDTVYGACEQLLRAGNMNIGNDLVRFNNKVMYGSTPLTYTPKLDGESDAPVYTLNTEYLQIGVQEGWEDTVSPPILVPGYTHVYRVDTDCTLQMVCTDVRRQGVLYVA
jgi:hypothetical protein